jgi:hypothetical protein
MDDELWWVIGWNLELAVAYLRIRCRMVLRVLKSLTLHETMVSTVIYGNLMAPDPRPAQGHEV